MKSIFQSKTFWFNLITGIVGGTTFVTADSLTQLGISGVWQHRILALIGVVGFVGNIYLRTKTSQGVVVVNPLKPTDIGQPS